MSPAQLRGWAVLVLAVGLMVVVLLGALDAVLGGLGQKGTDALMGVLGVIAGVVASNLRAGSNGRHRRE